MKFGLCCAPGALGQPQRLIDVLVEAEADYLDWSVGTIMADEAEFENLRAVVTESPLKPLCFMGFLPPSQRITGPDVRLGSVLNYAQTAMTRARALGGEIIVLGSAGARKVPAGFDLALAHRQFVEFCRELAPRAEATGITIAIEPLSSGEDNFLLSVAQGAQIVDEVAHARIGLAANLFHMSEENEPFENLQNAGNRLKHVHLADLGRVAPGFLKGSGADFTGFFRALRMAHYDARCSFEGKTSDLARQARPILQQMRLHYAQSHF